MLAPSAIVASNLGFPFRASPAARGVTTDGSNSANVVYGMMNAAARKKRGYDGSGVVADGEREVGGPGGVWLPSDGPGGRAGAGSSMRSRAVGAPGQNYVVNKNRVINAHYRTSPIPYQTSVAINCAVERPQSMFNSRKANAARCSPADLLAPVMNVDAFRSIKGELAYQLSSGDGAPLRAVNEYDGYPNVFTCVNGLSIRDSIQFAGYMAFNQNADHPDETGTLVIAGTVTVTHTGPYPIRAGQIVYFSPYPYIRYNEDGEKEPAIRETGIPGGIGEKDQITGVSLAKFKPALYGLHDQDTASFVRSLEKIITGKVYESLDNLDFKMLIDADAVNNKMLELHQDITSARFLTDAPLFPMRKYAEIFLWRTAFVLVDRVGVESRSGDVRPAPVEIVLGRLFFKKIKEHFNELQVSSAAFKDALGSQMVSYSHIVGKPEIETRFNSNTAHAFLHYDNTGAMVWPNPIGNTRLTANALLLEWSRGLLQFYFADQEDFLRSHAVGTAMRDAHPGHMLDLMLGYFLR